MKKSVRLIALVLAISILTSAVLFAETFTYDELGRLVQIECESGTITTFTHDANGNITGVSIINENPTPTPTPTPTPPPEPTPIPPLPNTVYDMQSDPNWRNITSSSTHPIMRGTNSAGTATRVDGPPRELQIPVRTGTSQGIRIRASVLLNALSGDGHLIRIEYSGRLSVAGSSQIRIEQSPAPAWEQGVNIWTEPTDSDNTFTQVAVFTREQLQHAVTVGTGDITLGATPGNAELIVTGINITEGTTNIPPPPPLILYDMQDDANWRSITSSSTHPVMRGTNSAGTATRFEGPPRELRFPVRTGTSQGLRIRAGALLDMLSYENSVIMIEYSGRLSVAGSSQIRIEQSPSPTWEQGINIWTESTNGENIFTQTVILTREQLQHAVTAGTGDITLGAIPGTAELIITDITITEIPVE